MDAKRQACAAVCAVLIVAAGGCIAAAAVGGAAAGAGAAIYYAGKYQQTFDAPLAKVFDAASAALRDQGLKVTESKQDKASGHLESEYADGRHVWIDMEAEGKRTQFSVRVGVLPDKDRETAILEGVKKRL
jgi:hypothetical protein